MPSLRGIEDVVAPSHHLASLHGRGEGLHLHGVLGISVTSSARKEHQRALVGAPGLELDNPVLADLLVGRVIVHVLALGMVDSCNLRAVHLLIPRVRVDVR